jgi:hypothetical protein
MRILFDHGTPSGIAGTLTPHQVTEARDRGWETLSNGDLLRAAEDDGFDLLLTTDKRIRYQQILANRKIAIIVLGNSTWRIVRLHLEKVAAAVNATTPGCYVEIEIPFDQKNGPSQWALGCAPKATCRAELRPTLACENPR